MHAFLMLRKCKYIADISIPMHELELIIVHALLYIAIMIMHGYS